MANVLEKIVADKIKEIAQRKVSLPLASFIDNLTPSDRSFYDALAERDAGFIFECKKASPSKGLIRDNFDLDEIIAAYGPSAACISVLTDEKYFQGRFEYLRYVRERVTQPVLNKDFFVEPYQIYLARYHNADAVLLMLSVLDDDTYTRLSQIAAEYHLDVLTEVSNEEETHRAIKLGARIIGINNRNLRDLSTDLATTETLVPIIRQSGHSCLIISESGIYTHSDVLRLAPEVDGFLVGSSLMAEANLKQAINRLLFGEVKVCGITRASDAQNAIAAGAAHCGLIFAEQSKRCVTDEQARDIVKQVPYSYVGVFVDAPEEVVAQKAKDLSLHAVQLHGKEDQHYVEALKQRLPDTVQIWKALGVSDTLPDTNRVNVDRVLLDCQVGAQSGGTGQVFDWQLLNNLDTDVSVILAGGITPDNIAEAAQCGVSALDINSGVETAPGIKDAQKLANAFGRLRQY